MQVLHIVTLVSPAAEYGGPVRVAINQCAALSERGIAAQVVGGTRGFEEVPEQLDGVTCRLFPVRSLVPGTGFAGLTSPALLRWLKRHVADFDVVHVHLARDLVTLPAARIALASKVPLVLQTHGMIDSSSHPLARPLDAAWTRRTLRRAKAILYLTEREKRDLAKVAGPLVNLRNVINGVPVAQGQLDGTRSDVLFLARLHRRKRPEQFVRAAIALRGEFPDTNFVLIGPDEGEGAEIRSLLTHPDAANVSWLGAAAPEVVGQRMADARVYVLPSIDEPFPMSVLEAMAAGTPVVITQSCGLADMVARTESGLVTDTSTGSLTQALRTLLSDPRLARTMGANGRAAARESFSMAQVSETLVDAYEEAIQ